MTQCSFEKIVFVLVVSAMLCAFGGRGLAQEIDDSPGGYIDNAQIANRLRLRFDAGFDLNRPDRAEFFYASWANLADHPHAIKDTNQVVIGGNNRGPILVPESVDFQEFSLYFELACSDRVSFFVDQPLRFVHFIGDINDEDAFQTPGFRAAYDAAPTETAGLSDMQVGFKYALIDDPDKILTFQFRTFVPTGDADRGLGTGHVSVEPGLLLYRRLTDKFSFMGQAKYWSPIDGGLNAGNIAIYGAGLSCDLYQRNELRIVPVTEFVGWTVLDGFETLSSPTGAPVVPNTARIPIDAATRDAMGNPPTQDPPGSGGRPAPTSHGVRIASGETIVNVKFGLRTYVNPQEDYYIGWGHSLTGHRWYREVIRLEYRRSF